MWLTVLLIVVALVLIVFLVLNYVFPEFTAGQLMALRLKGGGFADKRLTIPGFTIAYWEAGVGEPLVLVHGMGVDRGTLLDVAEKLKQNYRVILPDLPGFGDSDKPADADYGINAQVENLREIISALGLTKVHLGGHSMGGWISAGFAATYPQTLASLWLIAAAGSSDLERGLPMQAFRRGEYLLCCEKPSDLPGIMKLAMVKVPTLPHFIWETLGRRAAANYELHKRIFKTISDDLAGYDLESRLPSIKAPTLLVWGDSDQLVPPSSLETFKRLIPNAKGIMMQHIGHVPQMEAVTACAGDYIAFRQSLQGAAGA